MHKVEFKSISSINWATDVSLWLFVSELRVAESHMGSAVNRKTSIKGSLFGKELNMEGKITWEACLWTFEKVCFFFQNLHKAAMNELP